MRKIIFKICVFILVLSIGAKILYKYEPEKEPENPLDAINMFSNDEGYEEDFFEISEEDTTIIESPPVLLENQFPIKELTINPKNKNSYDNYDNIFISNATKINLDVEKLYKSKMTTGFKKTDEPQILIIHTHTTESYGDGKNYYEKNQSTRSHDQNVNIVKVGEEMAKEFENQGINVLHSKEVFDYPEFPGSYDRSIVTIKDYLKKYPSIKAVIDVHRDSMTASDNSKYRPVTTINGEKMAQVMIVSGTNEMLKNDNYKENLSFTLKIQKKMQDKFPTLARPLNLRPQRFNSHATKGSFLLEVGSDTNTLDEAIKAAKLSAVCIAEVIKENME